MNSESKKDNPQLINNITRTKSVTFDEDIKFYNVSSYKEYNKINSISPIEPEENQSKVRYCCSKCLIY